MQPAFMAFIRHVALICYILISPWFMCWKVKEVKKRRSDLRSLIMHFSALEVFFLLPRICFWSFVDLGVFRQTIKNKSGFDCHIKNAFLFSSATLIWVKKEGQKAVGWRSSIMHFSAAEVFSTFVINAPFFRCCFFYAMHFVCQRSKTEKNAKFALEGKKRDKTHDVLLMNRPFFKGRLGLLKESKSGFLSLSSSPFTSQ